MRAALEQLEASAEPPDAMLVPLAYLAGPHVALDRDELNAAVRRAELLLATGGDPRRELDPDGRAVRALAADLDDPAARDALSRALERLHADAEGLPAVGEALRALLGDGDLAWRSYAIAMVADALSADD